MDKRDAYEERRIGYWGNGAYERDSSGSGGFFGKGFLSDLKDAVMEYIRQRFSVDGYETACESSSRATRHVNQVEEFKRNAAENARRFHVLDAQELKELHRDLKANSLFCHVCDIDVPAHFLDSDVRWKTATHIRSFDFNRCNNNSELGEVLVQLCQEEFNHSSEELQTSSDELVRATVGVLCIENAAKVGMDGIIRPLLLHNAPAELFECDAVKIIVHHKWCRVWKKKFLQEFTRYCGFTGGFTTYVILVSSSSNDMMFLFPKTCLLVCLLIFGLRMFREEARQIRTYTKDLNEDCRLKHNGLVHYLMSGWNWLDLLVFSMLCSVALLHVGCLINSNFHPILVTVAVVETVLVYLKVLYYAQQSRFVAAFLVATQNITCDVCALLVVSVVILLVTAFAVYTIVSVAYPKNHEASNMYGTYGAAVMTLIDLALFTLSDLKVLYNAGIFSCVTVTVVIVFKMLESGLLLSALLALLKQARDRTMKPHAGQLAKAQASFIDASEAALSEKEIDRMNNECGSYLIAVLKPEEEKLEEQQLAKAVEDTRIQVQACEQRVVQIATDLEIKLDLVLQRLQAMAPAPLGETPMSNQ